MVLRLAMWEIKSVISAIRVHFTTEFFFEHGFVRLTRMLRSWRYCLPDSSHYMSWKSRDFVPGYSRCARYWLPAKSSNLGNQATKQQKNTKLPYFTNPLPIHFRLFQRWTKMMPRMFSSRTKANHIPMRPKPNTMPKR